jgi:hypothetical protein
MSLTLFSFASKLHTRVFVRLSVGEGKSGEKSEIFLNAEFGFNQVVIETNLERELFNSLFGGLLFSLPI